jgi:uncharacterized membrane protein
VTPDRLYVSPVFPLWLIAMLYAALLVTALLQYRSYARRLTRNRALALAFLRLLVLTTLVSFYLNPTLLRFEEKKIMPSVAVVVDAGESMAQPGTQAGVSRLDEAKRVLTGSEHPLLSWLPERSDVHLYALGASLKPLRSDELSNLKVADEQGDMTDALRQLARTGRVVILLSDGNLHWDENNNPGVPIVTIPIGNASTYKDILVRAVKAPPIAFRGREATIDVTVRSHGYQRLTIPVLLKEGSRLITAKSVQLNSDRETTVSFSFTPEEIGQKALSISMPQQAGETIVANNHANILLNVVRDKIRILMVSGTPSLNYRFTRMALKHDPSVDLLSFVILRTPSNILNVPTQEQSLIPFPVDTLFSKELKSFDLLIFDNFRHAPYLGLRHLEAIKEFVRAGGGFAVIGGPNLLDEERSSATPISEILPVEAVDREPYQRSTPVAVRLSRAGVTHPLMRATAESSDHVAFWKEMPTLDGINELEVKRPGLALLESADNRSLPILIVGSFGAGRTLVLATDYAWKWDMGMVARSKGNTVFFRFTEAAVRWLTKDPRLDPVQMALPESATVGREVEVKIRSVGEEGSARSAASVSLAVLKPNGNRVVTRLKATTQAGEYRGSFLPDEEGVYRVRAETTTGHVEEFLVVSSRLQGRDFFPDHELLARVAASTGGKLVVTPDDLTKEMDSRSRAVEQRIVQEKQMPLLATPLLIALILALLVTEWYCRRRWGLL